jgi:lipoprotein-anchoring transpeptidase ErfK/SrfK
VVHSIPDDPTQAVSPVPGPPRLHAQDWAFIALAGSLAVLVLLLLVILAALAALYTGDRVLPGVHALGVDLGGKSRAEAVAALQRNWAGRTITLEAGDTAWAVTPAMLGMALDAEATIQRAYRYGRSPETLKEVLRGTEGSQISPVWRLDPIVAEANLRALKPRFDQAPADAGLRVVEGRVEATPPVPGRELDVAATIAWLGANGEQVITGGRLPLVMGPVEPAVTDASALVDQANRLLARRMSIRVYDPVTNELRTWEVGPNVWGDWLSLGAAPGDATRLAWELNADKTWAFLTAQAAMLGADRRLDLDQAVTAIGEAIQAQREEVRLRVYHNERQHRVQPGETLSSIAYDFGIPYPWIEQTNPGIGSSLSVGQVVIIPSPDVLLPLPVVETKRVVVSLGEQRMWVYEGDALKWEWPVSTGIESSPTAPGVFQIQTHEPNAYASNWNLWMPYFMGIYRPVPVSDFMNGFHGFPTRGGSTLLWTGDLGHPVTYGCILISTDNASALYAWAEEGVVVEVRR